MASNDSDSDVECLTQASFAMSSANTTTGSEENSSSSSSEDFVEVIPEEEETKPPPPKKLKTEWSNSYSDKAMKLMKNMGYEEDKGLGKSKQGRLEPVEASRHEGRRGFGLKLENLSASAGQWDPTLEEILIPETIIWLKNYSNDLDNLTMDDLDMWVERAAKKEIIDDESKFCDPTILTNVLSSKSVFDNLNSNDMRRARTRSNPFETIRGSIFLNRAAVKMANIDSMCNFMFTNPVDENGKSLVKNNDLLYFADICAGPGGFTEYILYKNRWEAKGFGFTLRGENDFKLGDFLAGSPETFDPYYGVKEDGNIFDPENQDSFGDYVLKQTDTGVHFVMADGGFSVEGKENIQEILSKQLYLCQCLTALSILREKGHFVCKFFDIFTPFSVGLIYLMYKCFEEISICKPNTSRPANSERYLICKWKKPNTDTIRRHLFAINQEMFEKQNDDDEVYELVRYEHLLQDKEFFQYIYDSNNRIGHNQIIGLIKIAAYCTDQKLKEPLQAEYKKKCLELWKLPDRMRQAPEVQSNEALLAELLQDWRTDENLMSNPATELKSSTDLKKHISNNIYDWNFVPVCRQETDTNIKTFFLCKGRSNVYRLISPGKWESVGYCLDISPKTLVYGEIVTELIGEGRSQNKVNALHIIDGIALGGKDIRRFPLRERLKWCDKFARALNKPYKVIKNQDGQIPVAPIRCKKLYPLRDIQLFFDHMREYRLKENKSRLGFRIRPDDGKSERFFVPGGLMFFNEINPPYMRALSKSQNKYYYHDYTNGESHFIENLPDSIRGKCFASFRSSFNRRLMWEWTNVYQVQQNVHSSNKLDSILFRDDFNEYISKILAK